MSFVLGRLEGCSINTGMGGVYASSEEERQDKEDIGRREGRCSGQCSEFCSTSVVNVYHAAAAAYALYTFVDLPIVFSYHVILLTSFGREICTR